MNSLFFFILLGAQYGWLTAADKRDSLLIPFLPE